MRALCDRCQVREANPAVARWEAPDIVLEEQLVPVGHTLTDADGTLRLE